MVDGLRTYFEFAYTSKMFRGNDAANDLDEMDSFPITNYGISYIKDFDKTDIKVYLDISNLFDVQYAQIIYGANGYYPGSGREITVGSKLSF